MEKVPSFRLPAFVGGAVVLAVSGCVIWYATRTENPAKNGGDDPTPLFQEIAADSGITFLMKFLPDEQGEKFKVNLYDHGCGVAVADYDGDGWDDVYFVNQLGANALYRNRGNGSFEDKTDDAGVALGDRIGVMAMFADYDNDGRQDLFVTSVRGGNVLFHNEGNGKFKDVTKQAGVELIAHCQGGHFFDFDNDGYLDLLVTSTAKWTLTALEPKLRYFPGKSTYYETAGSEKEKNVLYRNNRNGTFTDVTAGSGLEGLGWAADVAVFDYDADGLLDVLITNMFGRAQLSRNQGKGRFEDVTLAVLGKTPWGGMGATAFDCNNDGNLDIYIVDMHSDMWAPANFPPNAETAKKRNRHLGIPFEESDPIFSRALKESQEFADLVQLRDEEVVFGNAFFKNLGKGNFVEMSAKADLENWWPWGIACGDFDRNGYEDIFIPAGMGYPFVFWPNYLMMNDGKEMFVDQAVENDVASPHESKYLEHEIGSQQAPRSSRSAAVGDFDRDGRLDLMVNNFNDGASYFRNQGSAGQYVALRLQGTKSNRDAIGAVARLYTGKQIMTRQVHTASGYLAQSSRVLHFGLPQGVKADRIDIIWPSGQRQTIAAPALGKMHDLVEPKE